MTALTVLRTTWVHHDIQAVRRSAAAVSSISPSPLLEEEEEEEEEEEDFLPSLDARRAGPAGCLSRAQPPGAALKVAGEG